MLTRLILAGVLLAALISGGMYVKHVITKNAEQAMEITQLKGEVASAEAARDKARKDAIVAIAKINGELELANRLAEEAAVKQEKLNRRLSHANAAIETWKLSSAVAAAALGQPMPAGVLPEPEVGPTTRIYRDPCTAASPSYESGTGTCSRSIAEGLRLGNEMQKAFRACNLQLEQLRMWSAALPAQ